jgi:maltooligosyltrehalose trehalohydrolase
VGNRAVAERLSDVASTGKTKIGAAVVLLSPFVPMLFQGEEFAACAPLHYFTDFNDPELSKAVTEGRKAEHAAEGVEWKDVADPQDPHSFTSSKLGWNELEQPEHADVLAWYKELIRLRRERDELRDADVSHLQLRFDEGEKWLVMQRGATTLACNFSGHARSVDMPGEFTVLLASQPECCWSEGKLVLPPESAIVLGQV